MDQTTVLMTKALAVAFAGGFAWSMINLVWSGRLGDYLAVGKFETLVLSGGVLLTLAVILKIRAIATGKGHVHDHDHEHEHGAPALAHAHAHDHSHAHDHAHDHGHSHGDADTGLWRYFVLVFPLSFIFFNMAPTELSAKEKERRLGKQAREGMKHVQVAELKGLDKLEGDPLLADWKNLEKGSSDFQVREWYKEQFEVKKRAFKVWGQFMPDPNYPDRFRIMVQKRTCCAADQTSLGVTVIAKWGDMKWKNEQWVEIVGAVVYHEYKDPSSGTPQYLAVIYPTDMRTTTPKPMIDV